MTLTKYDFQCAMAGFFEISTEDARRVLPSRFSPLEVNYGRSILMVNFYDFAHSPVGPYRELVYGIMVAPRILDGVVPKGAVYPWQVATTTAESRAHAIERWHLPHWPEDVQLDLHESGDNIHASATVGGTKVVSLKISGQGWKNERRIYQSFMKDDEGAYMAQIQYDGELSEHEEETGVLELDLSHPFNRDLVDADIEPTAFREIWQRGVQTFQPLETLT